MNRKAIILFSGMFALTAQAQIELSIDEAASMSSTKTYNEIGIHDPSIYFNPGDETYYIIGSHIGFAKTTDMLNMTDIGNSGIYSKDYSQEFTSCPDHSVKVVRNGETFTETLRSFDAGAYCATYCGIQIGDRKPTTEANWISGDQWAPDVIYNPNMEKWCMYLSLNGDYWASTIVLLTSDNPDGPFKYEAPIISSGFNGQTYSGTSVSYKDTDLEIVLGPLDNLPSRYNTSTWGNLWPNCIDPCVFFDENDELWITYGSWSGGIFILKLDKNTGLRDYTYSYEAKTYTGKAPNGATFIGYSSDPYFGKLIAGGCYVSGEGPYIQKIGDYYYLFLSYGGFAPDGGYEMRVFRSESPDGPYTDASGETATYSRYQLNYGPNAVTNKGMKILGSMNNWGNMSIGECAEGHNSAIVDQEGDAFVVYHTKFNNGTFGFNVRTRQLFVNEDGWLVASPFRFTGKQTLQTDIDTRQLFKEEEIAGVYKMLIHPYRLNHEKMEESTPVTVELTADGKISGEYTGTWTYSEDNKSYVTLNIDNDIYYGVAMIQNVDGSNNLPAICFTAVSYEGVPVWMYKLTPKAALADAYATLLKDFIGKENSLIKKDAPVFDNVQASFSARNAETGESEPETLSPDGEFTRTVDGHSIIIDIELQAGDYVLYMGPYTRKTRSENEVSEPNVYYPESQYKNLDSGWWSNFSEEEYELQQGEKAEFHFYNYSSALENWHNWALYGASTTHGANGYNEYFGIRCDNWDNTSVSNQGCTSDFNWDTFKKDMDGSLVDMNISYDATGVFTMKSTITTTSGKIYNYSYKKTINTKPEKITLFFVSERSYIDGSNIDTGVSELYKDIQYFDNATYNVWGQKVDSNYKGIVIRNGHKYIQR